MKSLTFLILLLSVILFIGTNPPFVNSVYTGGANGNTYIKEDGSIQPSIAPIQKDGDVYTITDDFHGVHLIVERSNIVVNGNGFTLYTQNILLKHVKNVTIKNFKITNFGSGVDLDQSANNTITNNTIWGCGSIDKDMGPLGGAIFIHGEHSNLVYGNIIRDNKIGIIVYGSPNTIFYNNTFLRNQFDVSDFGGLGFGSVSSIALFDNGEQGNYWDEYDGEDKNGDGIGDKAHIIDENNQDNYPLIEPILSNLPPKDELLGNDSFDEFSSHVIGFITSEIGIIFLGVTIVALIFIIIVVIFARRKLKQV